MRNNTKAGIAEDVYSNAAWQECPCYTRAYFLWKNDESDDIIYLMYNNDEMKKDRNKEDKNGDSNYVY